MKLEPLTYETHVKNIKLAVNGWSSLLLTCSLHVSGIEKRKKSANKLKFHGLTYEFYGNAEGFFRIWHALT